MTDVPNAASAGSEPATPGSAHPARPRPARRRLLWTILALVVILPASLAGFYAVWTTVQLNNIPRDSAAAPADYEGRPPAQQQAPAPAGTPTPGTTATPTPVKAAPPYLNYVIMGSDARPGDTASRSDVLMVVHVNPARDKVYLISFPRDMYVNIPGRGMNKINAAYAFGGAQLTVRTLEQLLEQRMDHVVEVDFEGFIGLTRNLGGVTVYNRLASDNTCHQVTYHYPAGNITISGERALCYVRERKDLPHGDLDRAERHRAVFKAILNRLTELDVLANPVRFAQISNELTRYFEVDSGLTTQLAWETALSMRIRGSSDVASLQAPITGFGTSPAGASIDIVNMPQLKEMAAAMRTNTMPAYCAKYGCA